MKDKYNFYKEHKDDKVYWVDNSGTMGEFLFSFDKKKVFNLYKDYPEKLSKEEKIIFDKENPYWKDYFSDKTNLDNKNH